jgi:hypothetical protein
VADVFGHELRIAVHTPARYLIDRVLAATMSVQGRGAVRADDLQVLQTVVVADAADVIEDERHSSAVPLLTLSAELVPPLGLAERAGIEVGLLRTERGLRSADDVRALLVDPLCDEELRRLLSR